MKGFRARLDYVLKHNVFFNKVFSFFASLFLRIIGIFVPFDEKGVLFSGHGRKYNDSPRAIYEKMISDKKYSEYHYYWAIDNDRTDGIPGSFKIVKPDTLKYFIVALKCKYWVTCVNIERGLKFKKKRCRYINTWHGIPIKTVGNDAVGRKDYNFSNIDKFCISGEYEKDIYIRSFRMREGQLLRSGMPRNDELYNVLPNQINVVKERLGIPFGKKVLLYAPTWRDSRDGGKTYSIAPPIDIKKWEKALGNDFVLLLRTHPYTNNLLGISFNSFVIDCSNYPRINDLLMAADVLISDYSATIFDFAILERPIICFAYDYEDYSKTRGLLMRLEEEMPCGVVKNENELIDKICNLDYLAEARKVRAFKEKYVTYGGKATDICIEALLGE